MPQPPAIASSRKGAEGAVVISSLVVLSVWGYRKLIEPSAQEVKSEPVLSKIIGAEPTPANSAQFATAFGFVFFSLAIGATVAPDLAAGFAVLVAVGYLLTNGASVFGDIQRQVSGKGPQVGPAAGVTGNVYAGVPMVGGSGPVSGVRGGAQGSVTAPNPAAGVKGSSGPTPYPWEVGSK